MAASNLLDLRLIGAITLVLRGRWSTRPFHELPNLMESLRHMPDAAAPSSGHFAVDEVLHHLGFMEAMGVVVREFTGDGWNEPYTERWRVSRQHELLSHLQLTADAPGGFPDGEFARVKARADAPTEGKPNANEGGGRNGDGGRNGGDGNNGGDGGNGPPSNDDGDGGGDGNGAGMREVLAHPVLFALPDSDYEALVDGLFSGDGAA